MPVVKSSSQGDGQGGQGGCVYSVLKNLTHFTVNLLMLVIHSVYLTVTPLLLFLSVLYHTHTYVLFSYCCRSVSNVERKRNSNTKLVGKQ